MQDEGESADSRNNEVRPKKPIIDKAFKESIEKAIHLGIDTKGITHLKNAAEAVGIKPEDDDALERLAPFVKTFAEQTLGKYAAGVKGGEKQSKDKAKTAVMMLEGPHPEFKVADFHTYTP